MSNDDRTKLKILLSHWIEHNKEHSQEFQEWADKMKSFGEPEVGEEISRSAQEMNKAGDFLFRALTLLEGK